MNWVRYQLFYCPTPTQVFIFYFLFYFSTFTHDFFIKKFGLIKKVLGFGKIVQVCLIKKWGKNCLISKIGKNNCWLRWEEKDE